MMMRSRPCSWCRKPGFGGYEKLTYAHEYTHVLQDQVYGFDDKLDMSEEACQADSEKCAGHPGAG